MGFDMGGRPILNGDCALVHEEVLTPRERRCLTGAKA